MGNKASSTNATRQQQEQINQILAEAAQVKDKVDDYLLDILPLHATAKDLLIDLSGDDDHINPENFQDFFVILQEMSGLIQKIEDEVSVLQKLLTDVRRIKDGGEARETAISMIRKYINDIVVSRTIDNAKTLIKPYFAGISD